MKISELYREFNLQPSDGKTVKGSTEKFLVLHEKIVDDKEILNISFKNIQRLEDIRTAKGAFSGNGIPMVIYERRHINRSGNSEREFPYLYHMFWCERLQRVFGDSIVEFKNKFVGSYRLDGNFSVFVWHNEVEEVKHHHMCKDCYCQLAENYGGLHKFRKLCGIKGLGRDYATTEEAKNFSLGKFYQDIRSGKIKSIEGITNVDTFRMFRKKDPYYRDLGWAKYAYELKKANGFQCKGCGKKFVDKEGHYIEKTLQVHHKDLNPLNTSLSNHVVLCVECHKKEHKGKEYVDVD